MGLVGGIAKTAIAAGTWTAVSNGVSKRQAGRWAAQAHGPTGGYRPPPPGRYQRAMFRQQAQPPPPVPVYVQAPPPDPMTTRLAHLQQLGALKAQGLLTEAEFEAQKRQILGT